MFSNENFKEYRKNLGFSSKVDFKNFLSAKDIEASVDFAYIGQLNDRLCEIFAKINQIYYNPCDIDKFLQTHLFLTFEKLKNNGILNKLNNQGRRKEEVYFSWMRGFLSLEYFKNAICDMFEVEISQIKSIGDDKFDSLDSFKRTPKADLEFKNYRIEVQSGFQGINDIKQHKVLEAKRVFNDEKIQTLVLHFDLFNGQVAFVDISSIEDDDLNWITRQQMEGQTVFNIDQNYFRWLINHKPPKLNEIL